MVYTRMERRARPLVAVLPKQKSNRILNAPRSSVVLTASKTEIFMSALPKFILLLRGGISNRELSPEQIQAQIEKYMNWIDSLRRKGHFLAGEPLEEEGKLLSGRNAETVTDGPFAESKEAIGGYFIISARDLGAAVEISKGCPIFANGGTVEVRPIQQVPGA